MTDRAAAPDPRISVVVPVRNGEAELVGCIESLLAMTYAPGSVEIIVVDNQSTDRTADVIGAYPVIAASEATPGSSAARNAGVRLARGEIIAFTDADCVVSPRWAEEIAATFRDPAVDAVLGFAAGINANLHAAFAQRRWEESWFEETATGRVARRRGVDTRNCAIRRRVLDTLGGFDPEMRFCADLELSVRLNEHGCNVVFNPRALVRHKNPVSFRESREKSRRQLPYVLRLRDRLPSGEERDGLPVPGSAFHGIADRQLEGVALAAVIALLLTLRAAVRAAVSLGLALRLEQRWVFKLYKVFFGISYDAAILRARQHAGGG